MNLPPDQKRWLKYVGAFFGALILGLLLSVIAERGLSRGRVLAGVHAEGRDLTGLDEAGIEKLFESRAAAFEKATFVLKLESDELEVSGKEVGLTFDVAMLSQLSLAAGRQGGWFERMGFSLARLFGPYEQLPVARIDTSKLKKRVAGWVEKRVVAPSLPEIRYEKKLIVSVGSGGTEADYQELGLRLTSAALNKVSRVDIPLRKREPVIPHEVVEEKKALLRQLLADEIVVLAPDDSRRSTLGKDELGNALIAEVNEEARDIELDLASDSLRESLEGFLAEIELAPVEATFEFSPRGEMTIGDSAPGKRVDSKALVRDIWVASKSATRTVKASLVTAPPRLSTKDAQSLGVKELVSSFMTMHPCCQNRVKNIHHAASVLDGTVLKPGEKFSLNGALGRRMRSSGYHQAPTIVHGKMKDVYGGGISQLATTLFNAVLRGGYEIVQRQPHSVYFARYPEGHEATVSYPEPDLIFRNDTQAGMVIQTQYSPTFIKVLVYGDGEGRVTKVEKSRRYNIKEPPKEYEPDEEMDPPKQKRLRAGQLGWTVLVSRTVKTADGREKKEKREVVYNPRPELLRVHPCMIPEGEEGHSGEKCPEPEIEEVEEELSEDEYFETEYFDTE